MYVIVKSGVYRHEICGVIDTMDDAIERANTLIMAEKDDYHEFEVLEFMPNTVVKDGKLVYLAQRKGERLMP